MQAASSNRGASGHTFSTTASVPSFRLVAGQLQPLVPEVTHPWSGCRTPLQCRHVALPQPVSVQDYTPSVPSHGGRPAKTGVVLAPPVPVSPRGTPLTDPVVQAVVAAIRTPHSRGISPPDSRSTSPYRAAVLSQSAVCPAGQFEACQRCPSMDDLPHACGSMQCPVNHVSSSVTGVVHRSLTPPRARTSLSRRPHAPSMVAALLSPRWTPRVGRRPRRSSPIRKPAQSILVAASSAELVHASQAHTTGGGSRWTRHLKAPTPPWVMASQAAHPSAQDARHVMVAPRAASVPVRPPSLEKRAYSMASSLAVQPTSKFRAGSVRRSAVSTPATPQCVEGAELALTANFSSLTRTHTPAHFRAHGDQTEQPLARARSSSPTRSRPSVTSVDNSRTAGLSRMTSSLATTIGSQNALPATAAATPATSTSPTVMSDSQRGHELATALLAEARERLKKGPNGAEDSSSSLAGSCSLPHLVLPPANEVSTSESLAGSLTTLAAGRRVVPGEVAAAAVLIASAAVLTAPPPSVQTRPSRGERVPSFTADPPQAVPNPRTAARRPPARSDPDVLEKELTEATGVHFESSYSERPDSTYAELNASYPIALVINEVADSLFMLAPVCFGKMWTPSALKRRLSSLVVKATGGSVARLSKEAFNSDDMPLREALGEKSTWAAFATAVETTCSKNRVPAHLAKRLIADVQQCLRPSSDPPKSGRSHYVERARAAFGTVNSATQSRSKPKVSPRVADRARSGHISPNSARGQTSPRSKSPNSARSQNSARSHTSVNSNSGKSLNSARSRSQSPASKRGVGPNAVPSAAVRSPQKPSSSGYASRPKAVDVLESCPNAASEVVKKTVTNVDVPLWAGQAGACLQATKGELSARSGTFSGRSAPSARSMDSDVHLSSRTGSKGSIAGSACVRPNEAIAAAANALFDAAKVASSRRSSREVSPRGLMSGSSISTRQPPLDSEPITNSARSESALVLTARTSQGAASIPEQHTTAPVAVSPSSRGPQVDSPKTQGTSCAGTASTKRGSLSRPKAKEASRMCQAARQHAGLVSAEQEKQAWDRLWEFSELQANVDTDVNAIDTCGYLHSSQEEAPRTGSRVTVDSIASSVTVPPPGDELPSRSIIDVSPELAEYAAVATSGNHGKAGPGCCGSKTTSPRGASPRGASSRGSSPRGAPQQTSPRCKSPRSSLPSRASDAAGQQRWQQYQKRHVVAETRPRVPKMM